MFRIYKCGTMIYYIFVFNNTKKIKIYPSNEGEIKTAADIKASYGSYDYSFAVKDKIVATKMAEDHCRLNGWKLDSINYISKK